MSSPISDPKTTPQIMLPCCDFQAEIMITSCIHEEACVAVHDVLLHGDTSYLCHYVAASNATGPDGCVIIASLPCNSFVNDTLRND